jgi:hypothetical protein
MIRVIHHMADVPAALTQVRRALAPGGAFILEHANKRNLKAMWRYRFGQQTWNPHDLDPVEFVELNFDFHPEYIQNELKLARFKPQARRPVSFFRVSALKQALPTGVLVTLDGLLQSTGVLYAPSIFVKSVTTGADTPDNLDSIKPPDDLFACPETGGDLKREGDTLVNEQTGTRWLIRDGIYDFKAPLD